MVERRGFQEDQLSRAPSWGARRPDGGAFGGRVLGEDFAAGVGDRFVASRSRFSQQSLELGEDLLDRIEVGGIFGQKDEVGSNIADCLPHRLSLVGAEIVEDNVIHKISA
jgi:hypothetical protein